MFHTAKQMGAQLSWLGCGPNPPLASQSCYEAETNDTCSNVFEACEHLGCFCHFITIFFFYNYLIIIFYPMTFMFPVLCTCFIWVINYRRWGTSLGTGLTSSNRKREVLPSSSKKTICSRLCLRLSFTNRLHQDCTRSTNVGSGEGQPTHPLHRV